jgi:hypothetical protein
LRAHVEVTGARSARLRNTRQHRASPERWPCKAMITTAALKQSRICGQAAAILGRCLPGCK